MDTEIIIKMKRKLTVWENIFANDASDKGLMSKLYKEFIQLNTRRQTTVHKKWAKDLNRNFSREDMQMAHRHMKKCSISLTIREMQIKTTVRYHFTPAKMAIINKSINNKW